ncbi:hypothetical protein SOASR014_45820 [Pectobacterium carotovorum subsp. carotovorum]|nr:hypothetical protein SOASR014_45820 [Pectobacterium carotovorum subsp. carotovorum]GLX46903.1 hypothetical protein Pcaca01_45710 [Pectobacterium carotovorum subsp. carotovorum]
MKIKEFKEISNIEFKLLKYLNIIHEKNLVFILDNYPDYDLSGYDGARTMTYFFESEVEIPYEFSNVISVGIINDFIIHSDDICNMSKQHDIHVFSNDLEGFINEIYELDNDCLGNHSIGLKFGDFELRTTKVVGINNSTEKIIFSGSFVGDYSHIQPVDWNIYVECKVMGTKNHSELGNSFYRDLMAEAYNLMSIKNFKISYFLAFSSLESYINEKMNTNDTKDRLKDIMSQMIRNVVGDVNKNEIYTSIISGYKKFETSRNIIAHGRELIVVTQEDVDELILFTLLIICIAEGDGSTFEHLASRIAK